jgi:hypothetical protein
VAVERVVILQELILALALMETLEALAVVADPTAGLVDSVLLGKGAMEGLALVLAIQGAVVAEEAKAQLDKMDIILMVVMVALVRLA